MSGKNVIANRYEVIEHIGKGGMADVFKAIDTILNREVAIKILRADLSTDAVSILRFEREAQAATALSHPNIVEIYDVGDYKGHHFIVMEYVPGRTLKQVIRSRGPLLNEEAVDIMKQLTSAVAEAHSRNIIHRDIKPQNVIVKADGSVKILDFGIAMAKGSMQLTQANNVMGSVHYLAPELAKGDSASPQSDIYALGIVLYEMLAGDVPFKADQAVQVALKHMREPFPRVREINPTVPQPIENIIMKATAKDPRQRYDNCVEMYRDLQTCLLPERANEAPLVFSQPAARKEEKPAQQPSARPQGRSQEEKRREAQRKEQEQKERERKRLRMIIAAVTAVLMIGVAATLYMMDIIHFGPRTVLVPDIEGLTRDEAREICEENGLTLDEVNVVYELTDNLENGRIISVTPAINTEVEKGTILTITVSSGIGERMEDFGNMQMTVGRAQEYIADKYPLLKVSIVEEDTGVSPGMVIRQEGIAPGTLYNPSGTGEITLYYQPYLTVTIPDDIIGKPLNEAKQQLEAMGLRVDVKNRDTSGMSQSEIDELQFGVVIASEPSPGSTYVQRENNYIVLYYY